MSAFLLILLVLLTVALALLSRRIKDGPKPPSEHDGMTEHSAPDGNVMGWDEVQEQLRQTPPIAQADALIMPPVNESIREQEVLEIPGESVCEAPRHQRPIGGWMGILFTYCVLGLVLGGLMGLLSLAAFVSVCAQSPRQWGALIYLGIMILLYLADALLVLWVMRLMLRRDIRFRKAFTARSAVSSCFSVYSIVTVLIGGNAPKVGSVVAACIPLLWIAYIYRSARVRNTCGEFTPEAAE